MGHFYIELIHFRIVESGVDFDVTDYHLSIIIRPIIMDFIDISTIMKKWLILSYRD